MAYDFNGVEKQREFGATIPDGTFVWATMKIRPGGVSASWAGPEDAGLFKGPKDANSDTIMIDAEFTIQFGRYARQKWFQFLVIDGGQRDDHGNSKAGNITKSTIRAILESAQGIRSDDTSAAAAQARQLRCFRDLDGIPFGCKLGIEPGGAREGGGNFADKNVIESGCIITAEMPEYAMLRNGQEPEPRPSGRTRTAAAPQPAGSGGPGGWASQPPAAPPPPPAQGGLWSGGQQQQPAAPPPPPAAAAAPPPPPAQGGGWAQQQPAAAAPAAAPAPAAAAAPPAEGGPGWLRG